MLSIAEMEPGIPDDWVLDRANAEGALLLTADKDFGEMVYRHHRISGGVVLIRLAGLSPMHKADIVASVIREHGPELSDAFTVISPGNVRIRRRQA